MHERSAQSSLVNEKKFRAVKYLSKYSNAIVKKSTYTDMTRLNSLFYSFNQHMYHPVDSEDSLKVTTGERLDVEKNCHANAIETPQLFSHDTVDLLKAIFNITSAIVGAGILGLPRAVADCGPWGILCLCGVTFFQVRFSAVLYVRYEVFQRIATC